MADTALQLVFHQLMPPCRLALQSIFELLNSVYGELEDPAAPHFQLCLSILETVAPVRAAGCRGATALVAAWRMIGRILLPQRRADVGSHEFLQQLCCMTAARAALSRPPPCVRAMHCCGPHIHHWCVHRSSARC